MVGIKVCSARGITDSYSNFRHKYCKDRKHFAKLSFWVDTFVYHTYRNTHTQCWRNLWIFCRKYTLEIIVKREVNLTQMNVFIFKKIRHQYVCRIRNTHIFQLSNNIPIKLLGIGVRWWRWWCFTLWQCDICMQSKCGNQICIEKCAVIKVYEKQQTKS